MNLTNSLRFRVALIFAAFGATLSILLFSGIYLAAREMADRLIEETLNAELEDSARRYERNPHFDPPNTVTIKGFVLAPDGSEIKGERELGEEKENIPDEIRNLKPGRYDMAVEGIRYHVLAADRNGIRYFMLFDTDSQDLREKELLDLLIVFALFMTIASAGGGFWLALRILTPVTRLAAEVNKSESDGITLSLRKLIRNDEVGELARAFDRYHRRMHEFIEREKYVTEDVSHELRTPLAIILSTTEVLEQDGSLSTKQKERVVRIRRATQNMIGLTTGLLWMAREHQPSVDEAPSHVAEIVKDCVDKHRHLIGNRPIQIEVEVIDVPHMIIEPPLLEIVIGNLLRNALFNTDSGRILVRLDAWCLTIRDSGIGMNPEDLERALEHYYKGESSSGFGVGLSLVKRICERYGWRISLTSVKGEGTTVLIDFHHSE